jgi:integrase
MPVRRDETGRWRYRHQVRLLDGTSERISGTAPKHRNTKAAAEEAMREHADRVLHPERYPKPREEVPTLSKWFNGRFWREWVIGRKNKPTEVYSKRSIFDGHIEPVFGDTPIDEIRTGDVAEFRASLVEKKLSEKRINNILAVLSKPLKYAADVEMIAKAPRIGIFKVERPEIEAWDFDQYVRILDAAKLEGDEWYAGACLAGEAGLRVGEIKALRWREDVDLVARTVTVNRQTWNGETGTPKGRTRRTIPMTPTLEQALRRLEVVREGLVVRSLDGKAKTDRQASQAMERICRKAGLPQRGWHHLRHSFGTHAALFGVNPWRLQAWMGHKRIDETMLYVHVAEVHRREVPPEILDAAHGEVDPDRRVLKMLGGRGKTVARASATPAKREQHQNVG